MPEREARAQRPAIAVSRVSFTEFYNFCDYLLLQTLLL